MTSTEALRYPGSITWNLSFPLMILSVYAFSFSLFKTLFHWMKIGSEGRDVSLPKIKTRGIGIEHYTHWPCKSFWKLERSLFLQVELTVKRINSNALLSHTEAFTKRGTSRHLPRTRVTQIQNICISASLVPLVKCNFCCSLLEQGQNMLIYHIHVHVM